MINIFILFISCIIAFLLKSIDIKLSFRESNISLSIIDSFKILFIITKSFIQVLFDKNTSKHTKKRIKKLYFLHFNYMLTLLVSIIHITIEQLNDEKNTIIDVSKVKEAKKDKIIDFLPLVKESVPLIWNPGLVA